MNAAAAENAPMKMLVRWREAWKSSMQFAASVSMIDTQEVSAAKATMTKKTRPMAVPAFPMEANTLGRDTNIRLGPDAIPSVPEKTQTGLSK